MRTILLHSQFKKDYKRIKKRGLPIDELKVVVDLLQNDQILPAIYHDHALKGEWLGLRECHIRPDWLLIYRIYDNELILALTRTGSHADLFGL